MNDVPLSSSTKNLLQAAKSDLPSAAARTKIWAGVSGAVGGGAALGATSVTSSAILSSGAGTSKLLVLGTLFGGTATVGLAAALLYFGVVPPRTTAPANPPAITQPATARAARLPNVTPVTPAVPKTSAEAAAATDNNGATSPSGSDPIGKSATTPRKTHRSARPSAEDSLAREASLVAEARAALGRGDPASALRAIRTARALPSKQLVPEELAVEEQAFRALGESDEANGIDVMLRLQYPESALAR